MKRLFTCICFFVITEISIAQISIQTGFSAGFNVHSFTVNDEQSFLRDGNGLEATLGVPVEISYKKWSLQTGFYSNHLTLSYYFRTENRQYGFENSSINGINTFKIPFLFSREFRRSNSRFGFSPHAGISWLTNRSKGQAGTGTASLGELTYTFTNSIVSKNKFLSELGIDFNYRVFRNLTFYGGVTWSFGLQVIEELEFNYSILNRGDYTGTLKSRGSGQHLHIGFKLPVYR